MKVSVIVCTRNPRQATLHRVLTALASQSLPVTDWELLVVDNGSQPPLALQPVPGPRLPRMVVEKTVGLTAARLRGIRETTGEILVFVDDDNLLDPDYLDIAVQIAERFPQLGAYGGRITPEFEAEEPTWLRPFRSHLALTDFPRDEWANATRDGAVLPCGAGLCVRRPLAERWATCVRTDPRRLALGRSGERTLACEDTDLALCCIDAGYGTGRFTALHLSHVIPAERLTFAYHKRLAADIGWSYGRLRAIRGEASQGQRWIALAKTLLAFLGVKHRGRARALNLAYHFGYWRGLVSA